MKAGTTKIKVGTKIITTPWWKMYPIVTGTITHPFGSYERWENKAVAGIIIDEEFHHLVGKTGDLFDGDFRVLKSEIKKQELD